MRKKNDFCIIQILCRAYVSSINSYHFVIVSNVRIIFSLILNDAMTTGD